MALSDWSTTAALNVLSLTGITWDEGQAPSTVNDSARATLAAIVTAIGNYPGEGYKGKLINPDFEVWQRGAGGAASIAVAATTTAYTADRWYITTAANQASVIAQQTGLTDGSRFCARVQRNSGQTGTGAIVFGQPLTTDMLVPLRNKKISISARVRSGANWSPASGNLTMSLYVGTGTEGKRGGGFTSETTVATVTTALGTSSTVTLMSAASAAVLPSTATQGELQFTWTPVGTASTSDYVEIDEVQLELGLVASPFERRFFGHELVLCRRFYYKTFSYATAPVQNVGSSVGALLANAIRAGAAQQEFYLWFPVELRGNPTMTYFNPVVANAQARDATGGFDCSATQTDLGAQPNNVSIKATGNASTAVANLLALHATADADL